MASFSVGSHALEGDGALINLYYYLWKRKVNALEGALNVKIPSTLVFEHNFPKGWYYWSDKKDGIERKVGKEIDTKAVFREMSRPPRGMVDIDVVASYISHAENPETGQEETNVEYFDREGLHEFLTRRSRRDQGILQRFVPPNGKYNVTVQAIWSPHVTLVEKRQNVNALNDKRFGIMERVATYDGPSHFSREAFVAPHIQAKVKAICQDFTDHFQTTEHVRIARMVLFFKVDRNSDVWLLWSSSLRISDKAQLNLAPRFVTPRPPAEEESSAASGGYRRRPLSARVFGSAVRDPVPELVPQRPATARVRRSPRHREAIALAGRPGWTERDAAQASLLPTPRKFHAAATLSADSASPAAPDNEFAIEVKTVPVPPVAGVRRKSRSSASLWAVVRIAVQMKFTDVLAAEESLSEFVGNVAYSMYSHFLTRRDSFYFSMSPLLVRFFGEQFFQRFASWGVERTDDADGDFVIHIPQMSLVHLQRELVEWCEQVTRPLVDNERAIFMDHVRKHRALEQAGKPAP